MIFQYILWIIEFCDNRFNQGALKKENHKE